jgi:hypothetical protein
MLDEYEYIPRRYVNVREVTIYVFEDIIELFGGLYSPPDQCRMR